MLLYIPKITLQFTLSTGAYLSEQQHHLSVMCQDSSNDTKLQTEERKSKKRKSDDVWPAQKKGKPSGIADMMDSDSESDNSDEYVNEDENTVNSNSTNDDMEGRESSMSQNEFTSDLELSAMDATDLGVPDHRTSSDMDNSNDGDVDEIIRCVPTTLSSHNRSLDRLMLHSNLFFAGILFTSLITKGKNLKTKIPNYAQAGVHPPSSWT